MDDKYINLVIVYLKQTRCVRTVTEIMSCFIYVWLKKVASHEVYYCVIQMDGLSILLSAAKSRRLSRLPIWPKSKAARVLQGLSNWGLQAK